MFFCLVCVSSVEVESKNSPVEIMNVNDPKVKHITLDNLDPDSHYIFKVIARTKTGEGPPITRTGATLLDGGETSEFCLTPFSVRLYLVK